MRVWRWAPEAQTAWRSDRESAANVEVDVDQLVRVALASGFVLPRADAELVWLAHSADHHARWLSLEGMSDEQLRETLERHTRAAVEESCLERAPSAMALSPQEDTAEARSRAGAWRAENRAAMDSSNTFVERGGLPLCGQRKP
jgi:hypothetical protein